MFDLPRSAKIAGAGSALAGVGITGIAANTGDSTPAGRPAMAPLNPAHVRSAESLGIDLRPSMSSMLNVRIAANAPRVETTLNKRQLKESEQILRRAGFRPGVVDGLESANTRTATAAFQAAVGLEANGALDTKTLQKLRHVEKRLKTRGRLGPGQAGKHVRTVQSRLRMLGYDPGPISGIYSMKTASAVKAFRADQKDLTNGSGVMTPASTRALRREVSALNHAPYRSRVSNTASHRKAEARALALVTRRPVHRGDSGPTVAYVQQHLRSAGYDPQSVKGNFDDRTEGMVRQFQKKAKLPVTGEVDRRTWLQLRKAKLEARSATSPAQTVGEHSTAVKRTEQRLRELGYKPGAADGRYTTMTQKAVNAFRKKEGLGGRGQGVNTRVSNELQHEVKKKRQRARGVPATGYVNGQAFRIRVVKIDGYYVEVKTARAFKRMRAAAARDGVSIRINSGFRTMQRQRELYNCFINGVPGCNPANPPGYSNHQSGIALDLNTLGVSQSTGTGAVYNWLARNGSRFGFSRIPSEHWHWEYRG
jgi:peptidoglycan hydrolase-like protein with peptidoglycan-binding domain